MTAFAIGLSRHRFLLSTMLAILPPKICDATGQDWSG